MDDQRVVWFRRRWRCRHAVRRARSCSGPPRGRCPAVRVPARALCAARSVAHMRVPRAGRAGVGTVQGLFFSQRQQLQQEAGSSILLREALHPPRVSISGGDSSNTGGSRINASHIKSSSSRRRNSRPASRSGSHTSTIIIITTSNNSHVCHSHSHSHSNVNIDRVGAGAR